MAVYVDDLNIIGTTDVIFEIIFQLKYEFEMKDLGETTFLSWPIGWTSCKKYFSTSEFVYLKAIQTFFNGYGSFTKFPNGGTVIGSKEWWV